MSWYQNPTIAAVLGSVLGAIVTAAVSVFIWRRTYKVKRVDCAINEVSSLLTFSERIRGKLEVKFAGSRVDSVFLISMTISNTGNEAVEDHPILVRLPEKSEIVDYSITTDPAEGFGPIDEDLQDGNILNLRVGLLNPGDRVELEIVSLNNPSEDVDVFMKNANVSTRVYSRRSAESALSSSFAGHRLIVLAALGALPLVGGFARLLLNVAIAQRIDRVSRRDGRREP